MTSTPTPPPPAKKSNALKYVLIGCLSTFVLAVIVCAVGGYLVARNAKSLGAEVARQITVGIVKQSPLPVDQKTGMIRHIDRVTADFKSDKITSEDLERVLVEIVESPLFKVGMVYFAEQQYIQPSALGDDERKEASLNLQRFARGLYEGKIPMSKLEEVTAPITVVDSDGEKKLKENPTTKELRAFLAGIKQEADDAEIPEEPFEVDIADELGAAIDRALEQP